MKRLLFFLLVFFIGCGGPPEPPKWYNQTYTSQIYIYGKGSAITRDSAINNALSDAAAKVSVTINSSFESSKRLFESKDYADEIRQLNKDIRSEVKNINFSDYEIVKEKKVDDVYFVVVKINKYKTAQNLYESAKAIVNDVKDDLAINDKVKILKIYPKDIQKLNKAISDLTIALVLEENDEYKKLLKQAINLKNALKAKLNKISVKVISSNPTIKSMIEDVFTDLNVPLGDGIKVYVNANVKNRKIMRYYVSTIKLRITLRDKSALTYEVKCGGKALSGFENAFEFAISKCKDKVEKVLKKAL